MMGGMKKITRWWGALLGLGLVAGAGAAGTVAATTPQHRFSEAWWKTRHQKGLERARAGGARLVFLGDSITQGWEDAGKPAWNRHYAHRAPINLGFSGDRTEHALWRITEGGELEGLDPKVVVIMLGTNNTGHRMDPAADVAAGMSVILEKLKAQCPHARILLLGIFPRGEKRNDPMRVRNTGINAAYARLADGRRVVYADIGLAFLKPDGTLPRAVMPDLLHLNAEGYRRWAEAMEPHLSRLLGDKPVAPAAAPAK